MAEKDQKQGHPIAPAANGYDRSDQESAASHDSKDARSNKYMKWCLYIIIFAIFQIGVITLFALTIAKFRTPRFRVESATFSALDSSTTTPNPSFNITMTTQLSVKNTNFGHFRYQESAIDFYFLDRKVGEAYVEKGRAKWRSTRRFNVVVSLTSATLTDLSSELGTKLSSGVIKLRSQSRLKGKVKIMVILSKKKNANMDCTMDVFVQSRVLQNIICL